MIQPLLKNTKYEPQNITVFMSLVIFAVRNVFIIDTQPLFNICRRLNIEVSFVCRTINHTYLQKKYY